MNLRFFQFQSWKKETPYFTAGCWFRIFGYGLHFSNGSLSFSERNGYAKFLKLPFGFRVKFLKKI